MKLKPTIAVRAVLWNRLCGKGPKVSQHATLEAAIAFIDSIESGLKREIINGELTFWDGDTMLSSVCVEVAPNDLSSETGSP